MTKQFLDFPIIEGKQNKHDRLLMVLLANSTFHEGVRYLKKENINASQVAKKLGKARSYTARAITWLIKQGYIEAQEDKYIFPKLETGSYSRINMSLVDKLCAMPDKAVVVFAYMNKFKALSGTFSKKWLLEKGLGIALNGDSYTLMNKAFEELEKANLVKVSVQTKNSKQDSTIILFVAEHIGATVKKEVVEVEAKDFDKQGLDLLESMFDEGETQPTFKRKTMKDYANEAYDFG